MEEKKYPFKTITSELRYEFISISEEKEVKKVVIITKIDEPYFYNLALLDELENGELSNISESRNNDMPIILSTIFKIIDEFLNNNPQAVLLFKGSEERRHRLYRIIIGKEYKNISSKFRIFGFNDGFISAFESNQKYEYFLIKKI